MAENMIDKIRENPIPAAMIGIGLGWMIFGGRRRHSLGDGHAHHLHENEGYYGDVSATTPRLQQDDAAGGMGASISHDHDGMIDRVRGTVSDVRGKVSDVGGKVSDLAGRVREIHVPERVTERVSTMWDATSGRVTDVGRTIGDTPLALGIVALAAGLAAGLAVPETEHEVRLLGDKRDQLMDRAREAASDMKEKVTNVAERVIDETKSNIKDTVKDAARSEGLYDSGTSAGSTGYGSSTGGSSTGSYGSSTGAKSTTDNI